MAAADLSTWAQALCFTGQLRRVEPKRLRYRVLHVVGRLVSTGRRLILRLDLNWSWAKDLARAFVRLRAAPWPTDQPAPPAQPERPHNSTPPGPPAGTSACPTPHTTTRNRPRSP